MFKSSLLAALTLSAVTTLPAADVTVTLSGYVTQITGNVPTGASVGDAVTMTAVYDVAAPDLNSDPTKTLAAFTTGTASLHVQVSTISGPLDFWLGPAGSGDPLYVY